MSQGKRKTFWRQCIRSGMISRLLLKVLNSSLSCCLLFAEAADVSDIKTTWKWRLLFTFQSVKNPKTVYRHLQSLLGKKHDNLQVALYQKRFPEHQLQEDPVRGTVFFKYSEWVFFLCFIFIFPLYGNCILIYYTNESYWLPWPHKKQGLLIISFQCINVIYTIGHPLVQMCMIFVLFNDRAMSLDFKENLEQFLIFASKLFLCLFVFFFFCDQRNAVYTWGAPRYGAQLFLWTRSGFCRSACSLKMMHHCMVYSDMWSELWSLLLCNCYILNNNNVFFVSPNLSNTQNSQSKMQWSLSQPFLTRQSAGRSYRLHRWRVWKFFSSLTTTRRWPWTMESSEGKTSTARLRCTLSISFKYILKSWHVLFLSSRLS